MLAGIYSNIFLKPYLSHFHVCNLLEEIRNIEALLEKYFSNFWRNTSGSEIKSVAVKMSDMVEALKQVGNNLEEAWANLVQEHFSNPVLQVNYSNLITSASTPSQSLLSCPRSSPSPACPAGFCLADNTIQWRPLLSLQKRFLLRDLCSENSLPCRCCFVAKPIFLSNVYNFGFWNDLINFLRSFVQTRAISLTGRLLWRPRI